MISCSLEALSSALISLTDVTPAWPRPRQSHRGGRSGAFSVISGSFYQISSALFLTDRKLFLINTYTPPPTQFLGSRFTGINLIEKSLRCGNEAHLDEITVSAKIRIQPSCQNNTTDRSSVITQTESRNKIKKDFCTVEVIFVVIETPQLSRRSIAVDKSLK